MKRILFLDDCPARQKWAAKELGIGNDLVQVMTAECAIRALKHKEFDEVYLDHDLGGETYVDPRRPDTGSGVVRWIVFNKPRIGEITVHSMNTPAGNLMVRDLLAAGYLAHYRSIYDMRFKGLAWTE